MRRHLILSAISVLALTAAAQQLYAAESETAAPAERAARERPVPTRVSPQRAAPARQAARPAPAQQTAQSSWTGGQVGGFGGGNAGGGGFADPACVGHAGFIVFPPGINVGPPPTCASLDTKPPNTVSASGGFTGGWGTVIPGSRLYVGAEAMWSANRINHTYTLNQGYPGQFAACCQEFTTDTRTATTSIGSSFSALGRIGYLVTDKMLVYFSGGSATAKVSATFTHTAISNINFPTSTTVVSGSSSVSKTVTGTALGGGVEFAYLPGVKIRLQYMHAQFPDVYFVTPLPVTVCQAPLVGGVCAGSAETAKVTPKFNQVTVGVNFGI